ncbi:MAG: Gfo/Idh/MocA family oxidoreductase [Thermoproteota archaeon]
MKEDERGLKSLRVGIIGCGFIAESHVYAWRNSGARVVAVCDVNSSLARSRAEKWCIPRWYDDVSKMIESEDLDAVSVCTPPHVRLNVVKPIVEKGVHVAIEKPFAMSVEEAEKMVELANRNGVKLTVVHSWLFSHIMKKTMKYLRRNFVGEIASVEITMLHTKDDPMVSNPSHWCHKIPAGRFGENLPHPIYVIRAILGNVEVKHVHGSKLGEYKWMPIDELRVLLENKRGQTATIYISFNAPLPETTLSIIGNKEALYVNLSNNILIRKRFREINLGQVTIDNLRTLLEVIKSSILVSFAILTTQYKGMHTEFMKEFAKSILSNSDLPVTANEALETVKLHTFLSSEIHKRYFT